MGVGKQPRVGCCSPPPVPLDAPFAFDSTRDAFPILPSSLSHQ
jgi:hypothetical protein